jgi:hypothetical protein
MSRPFPRDAKPGARASPWPLTAATEFGAWGRFVRFRRASLTTRLCEPRNIAAGPRKQTARHPTRWLPHPVLVHRNRIRPGTRGLRPGRHHRHDGADHGRDRDGIPAKVKPPARPITQADLAALTEKVRRRVVRWFRMQRLLDADAGADMLARKNSGFSVDASVRITLIDRDVPSYFQSLEHLLRYCARPPLALEQLSVRPGEDGRISRVRYVLPRHKAANWVGPGCGGDIRLIAFITDPGPIGKILTPALLHTEWRTARAFASLASPWSTDRLERAWAGPRRPGNLSSVARRAARHRHPQPLPGSHATVRTAREKSGFKAGLRRRERSGLEHG